MPARHQQPPQLPHLTGAEDCIIRLHAMTTTRPISSHGRFLWYELATTDMEAAKAFYTAVVGWSAQDASMPGQAYTLFTAKGVPVGGLMQLPEEASRLGFRPGWLGYVGVDDVDQAAERVERLGGAVHVPPKEIPGISRLAVAVDPQMATIALLKWLEPAPQPPSDLSVPGRVGWHELLAADWEAAWVFYGDLFAWQKAQAETGAVGTYQMFCADGLTMGGMYTKPATVTVPFWLYYFNVGDTDAAATRVKAGGGRILNGPVAVPGGNWIVHCSDPQGVMFALTGTRRHEGIGYFGPAAPRFERAKAP